MISARMHRVGLAVGHYHARERDGVYVAWFQPETIDNPFRSDDDEVA